MNGNTKGFTPFLYAFKSLAQPNERSMHEEPHIGNLIKEELNKQGRTITWLARQLGFSRQNAYKIFNRRWIYTDLLLKICDLLDYDFFKCYSDYRNNREKE